MLANSVFVTDRYENTLIDRAQRGIDRERSRDSRASTVSSSSPTPRPRRITKIVTIRTPEPKVVETPKPVAVARAAYCRPSRRTSRASRGAR